MKKDEAAKLKILEEKLAEEVFAQTQTLGLPENKNESSNNLDTEKNNIESKM